MKEVVKHPECVHIQGVSISRSPWQDPHHANWSFGFVLDGPRTAPLIADEIGRRFQEEYDVE